MVRSYEFSIVQCARMKTPTPPISTILSTYEVWYLIVVMLHRLKESTVKCADQNTECLISFAEKSQTLVHGSLHKSVLTRKKQR